MRSCNSQFSLPWPSDGYKLTTAVQRHHKLAFKIGTMNPHIDPNGICDFPGTRGVSVEKNDNSMVAMAQVADLCVCVR